MRALSVTQPWATLIATGQKQVETRSWPTRCRGRIAIHAAKSLPPAARQLAGRLVESGALGSLELPRGVVLCTAELCDVRPVEALRDHLSPEELAYGDYSDGRWGWLLRDIEVLEAPLPARGMLGLWRWDPGDRGSETTAIP